MLIDGKLLGFRLRRVGRVRMGANFSFFFLFFRRHGLG
jgi:hypothetical protein